MVPIFPKTNKFLLCILLIIIIGAWRPFAISLCSSSSTTTLMESKSYVEDACSVTRYPDICIRSLASFSHTAQSDPVKWARAGVSVTIHEAQVVARYAAGLMKSSKAADGGMNLAAVSDCVELLQDALDVLHRSLYALRNFTNDCGGSQTEDIVTWLSAALTDEDTCLDGFNEAGADPRGRDRRRAKGIDQVLEDRVVNVTYVTSNALALASKLAN